jgi:hypothetical protein
MYDNDFVVVHSNLDYFSNLVRDSTFEVLSAG